MGLAGGVGGQFDEIVYFVCVNACVSQLNYTFGFTVFTYEPVSPPENPIYDSKK